MIDVVNDLLGDLLGEIRPDSPRVRPVQTRTNTDFSPLSPLSPAAGSETKSPHAVLRFRLIESQGSGTVIGGQGASLADLRNTLKQKYGARLKWTGK